MVLQKDNPLFFGQIYRLDDEVKSAVINLDRKLDAFIYLVWTDFITASQIGTANAGKYLEDTLTAKGPEEIRGIQQAISVRRSDGSAQLEQPGRPKTPEAQETGPGLLKVVRDKIQSIASDSDKHFEDGWIEAIEKRIIYRYRIYMKNPGLKLVIINFI